VSDVSNLLDDLRGLGREIVDVVTSHRSELSIENSLKGDVRAIAIVGATSVTRFEVASWLYLCMLAPNRLVYSEAWRWLNDFWQLTARLFIELSRLPSWFEGIDAKAANRMTAWLT
jgi:hypothetical protein